MAWVSGGTYFAMSSLRSAKISQSGRESTPGADSSRERHFIIAAAQMWQGSFGCIALHSVEHNSAQDDNPGVYIPGIFIPAMRRAKLGFPICLNIFFICAYWRSKLLTSCTVVPEPRAMRLRRLPLITS